MLVLHGQEFFNLTPTRAPAGTLASVSAASFSGATLASESIVAAFGAGLAITTQAAATLPLPTALAGTTINVKDSAGAERQAPIFFVSPGQVNYQMPQGTAPGSATVTITSRYGDTSTGVVQIAAVAPGLFAANANSGYDHDWRRECGSVVRRSGARICRPGSSQLAVVAEPDRARRSGCRADGG